MASFPVKGLWRFHRGGQGDVAVRGQAGPSNMERQPWGGVAVADQFGFIQIMPRTTLILWRW